MLTRQLPALAVERIAVAVVRWQPEYAHAAVVLQPSQLPVVGDVAPDQVSSLRVPGRSLRPKCAGPQPLDRRIGLRQTVETRVNRNDVRVQELPVGRSIRTKITWRRSDGAWGRDWTGRRLSVCSRGYDSESSGAERANKVASGERGIGCVVAC